MPAAATKFTRRWIKPSPIPDATALEPLLARFRDNPRVIEAWLVGSWITPSDGAPPYESTDIALVLDPPLTRDADTDRATVSELIAGLEVTSPITGRRRSWLFVGETIMRAHQDQAVLLYERSP